MIPGPAGGQPLLMTKPNQETVVQNELHSVARQAREAAGLSQSEAAEALQVRQPAVSKAENDPSGRYLNLQRRIIEELAGWELEGPLWKVNRTTNS